MTGLKHIAAFVAFCLTVSIVWCDDFDCTHDTAADECVSAQFESPGGHADPSSEAGADHHASHCSCICHAPSLEAAAVMLRHTPSIGIIADHSPSDVAPAPGRSIFRPPSAS